MKGKRESVRRRRPGVVAALAAAGWLYWLGGKLTPWVAIALPLALLALLAAASTAALAKQGPSLLRAL